MTKLVSKNLIIGLCTMAWLTGCNAETAPQASDVSNINSSLSQQNACQALSTEDIATTLKWIDTIESESMTHKDGKRSLCRFSGKSDNLWLRLGWKSAAAASNKVLEKQFQSYLQAGENGIVYESVSGDIRLFGMKSSTPSQPALYVYRKRFGNDAELMFELYSDSISKSDALSALEHLANKL